MARLPETTPAPTNPLVPAMSPAAPANRAQAHAAGPCAALALDGPPGDARGRRRRWRLIRPKLRLEIRDLAHPGTRVFLDAVDPVACVAEGVGHVARLLYHATVVDRDQVSDGGGEGADDDENNNNSETANATNDDNNNASPPFRPPPTRSVTLILRDMPGVAHTTSSDLDTDHKEIHLSLPFLAGLSPSRAGAEIAGVVTHELVHCFQHNGRGSCPGGLVEGVADWVRLRCGLAPPHWTTDPGEDGWDAGYETTAYFLDYLEKRLGSDFVPRLNEKLRSCEYNEVAFWHDLTQATVQQHWIEYRPGDKT